MSTMKTMKIMGTVFAVAVGSLCGSHAYAMDAKDAKEFSTRLSGFKEVPLAIFSPGTGTLHAKLDKQAGTLEYVLTYSGLTSPVREAHIHFGKPGVAGGIIAFLCSNLGNAPSGTPACPENDGTVSGTITAASIVGPQPQNIQPGNFEALVAALLAKATYANVHTTNFPAGEIRGDIRKDDKDNKDNRDNREDDANLEGQNDKGQDEHRNGSH